MKQPVWNHIVGSFGETLSQDQVSALGTYSRWLTTEGLVTGGIGPGEVDRIDRRHIGDSLLFAGEIPQSFKYVADLGSGVGLPGIPLAILRPDTKFELVDRSGRRVDLLRRLVSVLDLDNVIVTQDDIYHLDGSFHCVVSRASVSPANVYSLLDRLLKPSGVAVFGGSWVNEPVVEGWVSREVGLDVLDQPVWLLIMRRQ